MSVFENFIYAELPLRPSLWKGLDAVGNPNSSTNPAVNGSPLGTLYLQNDVTPKTTWQKQGTASTAWVLISGSFKLTVRRRYIVTTAFQANETINLSTGAGVTGASSISGDSLSSLPSGWASNHAVNIYLNGVMLDKLAQISYSAGAISINLQLDRDDIIIVASEETI